MIDWAVVLTPLLVLPIVLLYRFVGCGEYLTVTGRPGPPRYRDYILPDTDAAKDNAGDVLHTEKEFAPKAADVIAYWRLLDKPAALQAFDEPGFRHGEYRRPSPSPLPLVPATPPAPPEDNAGSEAGAPGDFDYPEEGLIASEVRWCRVYLGGYVFIPFKHGLYTPEFSIEAWVHPQWGANYPKDFERTLFHVGGRYLQPGGFTQFESDYGFSVFADRYGNWQVRLAGHGKLFANGPEVTRVQATHIVVTMAEVTLPTGGIQYILTLYVNGKPVSRDQLSYSLPNGAGIFIGVKNEVNPLSSTHVVRKPVISMIQEVVLYRKALTWQEVENRLDLNR